MLSGLKFISREEIDKDKESDISRKEKKKSSSSRRRSKDKRKKRNSRYSDSEDDLERIKKGSRKKKKWYSSEEDCSLDSESENGSSDRDEINARKEKKNLNEISRKEMGLDWMLRPKDNTEQTPATTSTKEMEEVQPATEEVMKVNPRELNPYLKNNGSGYPEESDGTNANRNPLLSSAIIGDGGASWRLKALKRAQEQAAREGRKLDEVVEERWGSVGQLAVSVASQRAAPTHAHLRAINNRRRGMEEDEKTETRKQNQRSTRTDDASRHDKMRVPKIHDNLSWGKRRSPTEDISLSAAVSSINKFTDDGSFMRGFMHGKSDSGDPSLHSSNTTTEEVEPNVVERSSEDAGNMKPALSANQLAAKVLQLRMKGLHEEAEKLMKEAENSKLKQEAGDKSHRPRVGATTSRYIMHDISTQRKEKEEDADFHLAEKIMQNKKYGVSSQADDEYDYDDGPRRKVRTKAGSDVHKSSQITQHANRILTQQERCNFCFENPARPKHLVISIANFTYLSLPHWEPVVPGHCCILTMQHESSTRVVDNNVWDEIRNFKKCLIMMFANQDKELVFLETVMGLSQQRRHCLIECIPIPQNVAKQAPLYFKKAIDEAEEEWSQHNAKKLIDTSLKGLRASIPKNFPYFHVEFGLNKGFVHVIDDEKEFKTNFGLNVVRGMLQLPAEDMHRRRKHESVEAQKLAVAKFARDWEPFDWTKQLG